MRALPACQPCGQPGVHPEQEEGASVVALKQLGLPDAEQPWPSPWQQSPSDGGNLLLEQGQSQVQSQVKAELNLEMQKEMDQALP